MVDSMVDTRARAERVSTLGLKCGYWQVALHPSNKEKTVFSTGQGMGAVRNYALRPLQYSSSV
jgi:hypothetical protein